MCMLKYLSTSNKSDTPGRAFLWRHSHTRAPCKSHAWILQVKWKVTVKGDKYYYFTWDLSVGNDKLVSFVNLISNSWKLSWCIISETITNSMSFPSQYTSVCHHSLYNGLGGKSTKINIRIQDNVHIILKPSFNSWLVLFRPVRKDLMPCAKLWENWCRWLWIENENKSILLKIFCLGFSISSCAF